MAPESVEQELNEAELEEQEIESLPRNKKVLAILLVILFLVMISSGFFIYRFILAKAAGEENPVTKIGPVYETEEFVVNFSGSVKHYLKAQFALEVSTNKVIGEIEEKKPLLRDTINLILLKQTMEVLTPQGREDLKEDLIASLNQFLDKGEVVKIHYLVFLLT